MVQITIHFKGGDRFTFLCEKFEYSTNQDSLLLYKWRVEGLKSTDILPKYINPHEIQLITSKEISNTAVTITDITEQPTPIIKTL